MKTRPFLSLLASGLLLLTLSTACRPKPSARKTLRIGAALVPHAEILTAVGPQLKAAGLEVEILPFDDDNQLNPALAEGSLDANFFQHRPFLEAVAREKGYDFVMVGTVHVEPIGFYSARHTRIQDLPQGAKIGIPNNPSNEYRALALLEAQGLIRLKPGLPAFSATPRDILENPRQLRFLEVDVAQLPRSLADLDGAVINTNTVLEAKLDPKGALFREGADSPYANGLVVRRADAQRPEIQKLVQVLRSPEVKDFLKRMYGGAIVPAFS